MGEKKDVTVTPDTIKVSWSNKDKEIKDKKSLFEQELSLLLKKYGFIIYAANTLLDNGEVIPMLKVVSNDVAQEKNDWSEEVITVA